MQIEPVLPAVAGSAGYGGPHAMDRAPETARFDVAIGQDQCMLAQLSKPEPGSWLHQPQLDQLLEGYAWLPRRNLEIELIVSFQLRRNTVDSLGRNLDIDRITLDPDPLPSQELRHSAACPRTHER